MASGKEHTKINISGIVLSFIIPIMTRNIYSFLLPVGVAVNTYLLSPDLDLQKSDVRNNWGLFGFIWFPFALVVPHRSPFSHWPIIGTITKDLYLLIIVFGIAVLFVNPSCIWKTFLYLISNQYSDWFFFGQIIGDALHLVIDLTSSAAKKTKKQLRRTF